MKVSKLIRKLNTYDPDTEVGMLNDEFVRHFDGDILID